MIFRFDVSRVETSREFSIQFEAVPSCTILGPTVFTNAWDQVIHAIVPRGRGRTSSGTRRIMLRPSCAAEQKAGREFNTQLIKEVCTKRGRRVVMSKAISPRENSKVESKVRDEA